MADTLRQVALSGKSGKDTLVWVVPLIPKDGSITVDIVDAKGAHWKADYQISIRASRIIGKINQFGQNVKAYSWQGKIVHVSGPDIYERINIGIFDTVIKKDSMLSSLKMTPIIDGREFSAAQFGDKIFLMGVSFPDYPGSNVMIYDLLTRTWASGPSYPSSYNYIVAALAVKGKLYIIFTGGQYSTTYQVAELDLASEKWILKKNLDYINGSGSQLYEINNKIYFLGAQWGPIPGTILKEYVPVNDTWVDLPIPNSLRIGYLYGSQIVGLNGSLYFFPGSYQNGSLDFNDVEVYDPIKMAWSICPPILNTRTGAGVVNLGTKIFILGGYARPEGWTYSVEEYQP